MEQRQDHMQTLKQSTSFLSVALLPSWKDNTHLYQEKLRYTFYTKHLFTEKKKNICT